MTLRASTLNGLEAAEQYFGESLSGDLVERVRHSPAQHLLHFTEHLREITKAHHKRKMREGERFTGGVATESASLATSTPLAARDRLDELILLAPQIAVEDPVFEWAGSLDTRELEWNERGTFDSRDGDPSKALGSLLHGMLPVETLIRSGDITFASPDPYRRGLRGHYPTLVSRASAHADLDVRAIRRNRKKSGKPRSSRSAQYGRWSDEWDDIGELLFADLRPRQRDRVLERAADLDEFALRQRAEVAATRDLDVFFSFVDQHPWSKFSLPRMELSIPDAVSMRADEEVFKLFRAGLLATLSAARTSVDEEDLASYTSRLRSAAEETLDETVETLTRMIDRGNLWGMASTAVGLSVDLTLGIAASQFGFQGLPGVGAPGASSIAEAVTDRLVRKRADATVAAGTALRYATNIRMTGRL